MFFWKLKPKNLNTNLVILRLTSALDRDELSIQCSRWFTPLGMNPTVRNEYETRQKPGPVWMQWRRKKHLMSIPKPHYK